MALTPCKWQPEPTIAHKRTIDPQISTQNPLWSSYIEKKLQLDNPLLTTHNPTQCPKEPPNWVTQGQSQPPKLGRPDCRDQQDVLSSSFFEKNHTPHCNHNRLCAWSSDPPPAFPFKLTHCAGGQIGGRICCAGGSRTTFAPLVSELLTPF